MRWGIENILWVTLTLAICGVLVFVLMQSGKMDDCYKRGGHVVDTSAGWVCAKLERV